MGVVGTVQTHPPLSSHLHYHLLQFWVQKLSMCSVSWASSQHGDYISKAIMSPEGCREAICSFVASSKIKTSRSVGFKIAISAK